MAITQQAARQQILDDLSGAIDQIALAVASLGEAYDQLSVDSADRLEAELFRPAQKALGRARRTLDGFGRRVALSGRDLEAQSPGLKSQGAKLLTEKAVTSAEEADRSIAALQDSMLPIESGDAELRAGLAAVRELLDEVPIAAREFLRTLGR